MHQIARKLSRTTILIADPLPLFSDALARALAIYPEFDVYDFHPSNGPETVTASVKLKPDFALIDYWMPDMEGPAITKAILAQAPLCNIILLSWLSGPGHIEAGIEAGAVGFIPKDSSVPEVAQAIRKVYDVGGREAAGDLRGLIEHRQSTTDVMLSRFGELTPRQIEIVALLNRGNTTADIAKRLSISPKTVSNHITDLFAKTRTFSQTELVARARDCGFLK